MKSRTITISETDSRIKSAINSINTMFVGIITSVNYTRNSYSVQPILKHKGSDDSFIDTAIIADCPMCFVKTKDFYIRSPYVIGDMVYVGCSKESTDEAMLDTEIKENRLSGVSLFRQVDGIILGGIMSDDEPDLDSEYSSDFIIQNRNNQDLLVIKKSGGILAKTTTKMEIDSPLTDITGNVTIGGTAVITGAVIAQSTMAVSGTLESTGEITATAGLTATTGNITTATGSITAPLGAVTGFTVNAISTGNSL